MTSPEECRSYQKGDCAGLSCAHCNEFKPAHRASKEDMEIYQSATERLDNSRHRSNPYGSREVAKKEENFKAAQETKRIPIGVISSPKTAQERFDALKRWRRTEALKRGKPAYYIFNDQTLRYIAAADIKCKADLLSVIGIGKVKYNLYGEAIYRILSSSK